MSGILLLAVLMQAGPVPAPSDDGARPRFAIGADLGAGMVVLGGEGRAALFLGGPRVTIPFGGPFAFEARMLHEFRGMNGGLYELRLRRHIERAGGPDYVGFGLAGGYSLDGGGGAAGPRQVSFTAGWIGSEGRRYSTLSEITVMVHPSGRYVIAAATIGLAVSPGREARR